MAGLFPHDNPDDDDAPKPGERFADVAIERGIDAAPTGLTYRVPQKLEPVAVGQRVVVPLGRGNRGATGYVIRLRDKVELDAKKIKPITKPAPGGVSLSGHLVTLAQWVASYYVCPLGMVFGAMLPAAVTRGTGTRRKQVVRPAEPLPSQDNGSPVKLTKLQQALLDAAISQAGWIGTRELADRAGAKTRGPVSQLIEKGVLVAEHRDVVQSTLDLRAREVGEADTEVTLGAAQRSAVEHLAQHADRFGVHLLHGVTGSGKTEVYLRAIAALREWPRGQGAKGTSEESQDAASAQHSPPGPRDPWAPSPSSPPAAIILVPEIALTPQTVGRFLARFGSERVAVLHSGLTAAQRHAQWRRIHDGKATIVVGARSAVFAPVTNLGLIIVDEEHDSSYKQDQLPRYHARDVAIKRAQIEGVPVVLGSATPSLESYYNAAQWRMADGGWRMEIGESTLPTASADPPSAIAHRPSNAHYLHLPDRVPGMRLPAVEIVDLIEERRRRRGIHLLSTRLEQRLAQTLGGKGSRGQGAKGPSEKTQDTRYTQHSAPRPLDPSAPSGGQAMVLLNRRGYANYIACPDHKCGWLMCCDHCDASMVYHRDHRLPLGGVVRCHHCTAEQVLPRSCPDCGKKTTVFGLGTQKVEDELREKFPGAAIARMDSDTMKNAEDYQRTLDKFRGGEIDILLGTQMIAKGLDFPGVRLVGVISADTALNFPDFRARERTFQLIAQVAGRSGRSEAAGRVVLQTFAPDDPAVRRAAKHDYAGFAKEEIAIRQEMMLPPVGRLVRIVLRDTDHAAAQRRAHELANDLRSANEQLQLGVRLRGPHPCAIGRVADFHRLEVQLLAPSAAPLQKLMTALRNQGRLISDHHTAIDVDPVSVL
ncbi:primosomal protein N' [Phycisphaeraceae bacterium D3-23]